MKQKLDYIMLVDDNKIDNFFHERVIKKYNAAIKVIIKESAKEALYFLQNKDYSKNSPTSVIFLDINMPGMNGWEFLEEYKNLDKNLQCKLIVVMLTTSQNPDDIEMAKKNNILFGFKTKPLDKDMLAKVFEKYYF
ncbi:response regulator [Flavobacterium pectinovorum]|jgi:CheY-like chemotaxis protein|uniref:response regulator n=1 Tax=Flavobacterium TaxID=237 RepID=UPI0012B9D817|nr:MULTISPECIES: response regulator [Flavobacterium]WKL49599.1 response regulator [Flavobacterium pectinovorum]